MTKYEAIEILEQMNSQFINASDYADTGSEMDLPYQSSQLEFILSIMHGHLEPPCSRYELNQYLDDDKATLIVSDEDYEVELIAKGNEFRLHSFKVYINGNAVFDIAYLPKMNSIIQSV